MDSTHTKNWNNTEISIALAQGWHANSWSVPYEKKETKHQIRILKDEV